ncbi:hypothetical protein TrLO_g8322 [Triparma laevis f. longispina]|uniref:Uncharacterized protein n=1 Tax=Triparma laevis f. longispina TaxID=1714387 RepID=A0A9W7C0V5_9STRA|nr:hypothetical protein TrLO_g8322 [Triparma laevis f. longispina]
MFKRNVKPQPTKRRFGGLRELWEYLARHLVRFLAVFGNVAGEIRDVDNQSDLFNTISNCYSEPCDTGNLYTVSDGSVVRVAQSGYTGSPYAATYAVYYLSDKYIDLVCTAEPHSFVLDRNNQRRIMMIGRTGSDTMTITGFMFDDGSTTLTWGGMFVYNGDWSSSPTTGSSLDALNWGTLSGMPNSYTLG